VRKEAAQREQAEAPTPEEKEAKQAASKYYAILGKEKAQGNPNKTTIDSASFCDLLSAEAQAQTIHYAKVTARNGQKWDCESAIDLLAIRSKRNGGFKAIEGAKVIGINVQGDRATATVRFANRPAVSLPLVKENGEWKLASTPPGK
jgi:hypothetical protein